MDGATPFFLHMPVFAENVDDLSALVYQTFWDYADVPNVELEVRVGRVIEKGQQKRLEWPLCTATAIDPEAHLTRFDAQVSEGAFDAVYQSLNHRYQEALALCEGSDRVSYTKETTQDNFYSSPGTQEGKIRVTVDPTDPSRILHVVQKQRLTAVDIFLPQCGWDLRITASTEDRAAAPAAGERPLLARVKERRTYVFDIWRFDLTKVFEYDAVHPSGALYDRTAPKEVTYEVEMEVGIAALRAEKAKHVHKQDHIFYPLVLQALRNARGLALQASKSDDHQIGQSPEQLRAQQKLLEDQARLVDSMQPNNMKREFRAQTAKLKQQRQTRQNKEKLPTSSDPETPMDVDLPAKPFASAGNLRSVPLPVAPDLRAPVRPATVPFVGPATGSVPTPNKTVSPLNLELLQRLPKSQLTQFLAPLGQPKG